MRHWYTTRGEAGDRLLVPSFVLGDPWRTINAAAVREVIGSPASPPVSTIEPVVMPMHFVEWARGAAAVAIQHQFP